MSVKFHYLARVTMQFHVAGDNPKDARESAADYLHELLPVDMEYHLQSVRFDQEKTDKENE